MRYNRRMALSWSYRRKALYYGVAGVIALIVVIALWRIFFVHTPTCSDGVQNGGEFGVDCGGSCSLICTDQAKAPVVLWARSFATAPNTYTAAAYIQNLNTGAGARSAKYSFQLFDAQNILVVEKLGTVDIPPTRTVPIVEAGIDVGNRTVARTLFSFTELPAWSTITAPLPVLHLTQQNLSADGSRLSATIVNDSAQDAPRTTVAVVLFDAAGVARAASKTVISLSRRSQQQLVFTWPGGVQNIVRAEMTILPAF